MLLLFAGISLVVAHAPDEVDRRAAAVQWPIYPNTPLTTGSVDYVVGNKTFEGYFAYPASTTALPGLLVAHQFLGLGDMEKFRVKEMASRGFVAFAMDSYGKGNKPANSTEARAYLAQLQANPTEYTARILGGFNALKTLPKLVSGATAVNHAQLFATGYCAGGFVAFELARLDPDGLLAVAGFHPSLKPLYNSTSMYPATLRASVQAHHAQLDSAGDQGLLDFEAEMGRRNVSHWSTHKYGNCMHGWTDPTSAIYRAQEAEEAHANMRQLFGQLLGRTPDICATNPTPSPAAIAAGPVAAAGAGGLVDGLYSRFQPERLGRIHRRVIFPPSSRSG
jgi:dienelactone hydrolase